MTKLQYLLVAFIKELSKNGETLGNYGADELKNILKSEKEGDKCVVCGELLRERDFGRNFLPGQCSSCIFHKIRKIRKNRDDRKHDFT